MNPESALRCDCGYDFESGTRQASYLDAAERSGGPGSFWQGFAYGLLCSLVGLIVVYGSNTHGPETRRGALVGFAVAVGFGVLRAIVGVALGGPSGYAH